MSDDGGRPWYRQLPAQMAAVVVFLVALTTLAGNLLELYDKRRAVDAAPAPAAPAPAVQAPPPEPAAPAPVGPMLLQLERIVVRHDGAMGSADWRFTLEADGNPLQSFPLEGLDDGGGRNVVAVRDVQARLRLAPDATAVITVKGWRSTRFGGGGGEPDATGEGRLSGDGSIAAIAVQAADEAHGAFTFQFAADRVARD